MTDFGENFHGNFIHFINFLLEIYWHVPGVWTVVLWSNKSTHYVPDCGNFCKLHHETKTIESRKSWNPETKKYYFLIEVMIWEPHAISYSISWLADYTMVQRLLLLFFIQTTPAWDVVTVLLLMNAARQFKVNSEWRIIWESFLWQFEFF